MSNTDTSRPPTDFDEMVQAAAWDQRVTGAKFGLAQARAGSYGLLGAAGVCLITALFAWFSATLYVAVAGDSSAFNLVRTVVAAVYVLAAGAFVVLFFLARRNPWPPALAGLILYCILVLPSVIIIYAAAVYIVNFAVLIALIDGLRAAWQHRRIYQKALTDPREHG